jgi:hypothetical protein
MDMFFPKLWDAIQNSPLGIYIAESAWAFPTLETIHVFALVTVFGTIAIMDMRMIGLASVGRPLTAVSRDTLRFTWSAFILAAITGSLIFTSKASYYMVNPWFLSKLALMGFAGLNMVLFHSTVWKRVREFDVAKAIPSRVRLAGVISLTVWLLVIICGRMIGFTLDRYLPG